MEFSEIVKIAKNIRSNYNNNELYDYLITNKFDVSNYEEAFEDFLSEGDRFYKGIPKNLSEDEIKKIFEDSNAMYSVSYESECDCGNIFISIHFIPIYVYDSEKKLLEIIDYDIDECEISDFTWKIKNSSTDKISMKNLIDSCDELKKFFEKYIDILDNLEKYGLKCWR